MTGMPNVRVDDILIHPRDRDLIVATHGRSIYIADDITPLEQMKAPGSADVTLFDPRPAVLWKNDPQAQRRATNRDFKGQNPQGGAAIHIWANSDMGPAKLEFLLGDAGGEHHEHRPEIRHESLPVEHARSGAAGRTWRTRRLWRSGGARRWRRARSGADGSPICERRRRFRRIRRRRLVQPGTYMVRLTVGTQILTSSVNVLEDIWMRPQ